MTTIPADPQPEASSSVPAVQVSPSIPDAPFLNSSSVPAAVALPAVQNLLNTHPSQMRACPPLRVFNQIEGVEFFGKASWEDHCAIAKQGAEEIRAIQDPEERAHYLVQMHTLLGRSAVQLWAKR